MFTHPITRDTVVCLLAGGQGERLLPLTRDRAKPAVPFGGPYRIIDIVLSNCVNSNLRRIFVLTQYKALSLNRHLREGWSIVANELGEFIQVLPPQKRVSAAWYQGTADAVFQNLYSIGSERAKYVLILAGDHVYKMDYQLMLQQHVNAGADLTVGTIEFDVAEAVRLGVCEVDPTGRIVGWEEKPSNPKVSPKDPAKINASMGIYIFNAEVLIKVLVADAEDPESNHDFGKDIIPKMLNHYRVYSYDFVDENKKEARYWRDIGTLEAYYEANMDLISVSPVFNLYDDEWPIRTYQRQYPPAKFVFAQERRMGFALDSIVSMGSIISGGHVVNSILSPDVRVNSYSNVDGSILFAHVNVGRYSRIRRAIIDRHIQLPEYTEIGYDADQDRKKGYHITETGIVVVVPEARMFEEPE